MTDAAAGHRLRLDRHEGRAVRPRRPRAGRQLQRDGDHLARQRRRRTIDGRDLGQRRPRGPGRHDGERSQPGSGRGDRLLRARQRPLCARRTAARPCPRHTSRSTPGQTRSSSNGTSEGYGDALFEDAWQRAWPGQPLALLGWLRRHDPDTFDAIATILLCKDFVNYRLTGRAVSDFSDMSAAGLLVNAEHGLQRPALRPARVRGAHRQAARAGREHGRHRDAERCRGGRARPHAKDPGGRWTLRRGCERHRVGRCGGRVA